MKIQMIIEDNGVGISDDKIDLLFQDYKCLDEHQHMNQKGTGLGLSICKNLIDQMGGKIKPFSQLQKGTLFDIHFNFKVDEPFIKNM